MSIIPWSIVLDPERLSKLRSLDILDTGPEQSYNDLAEIARLICNTPIANVSLISADRQWFKAYVGNDIQETPIEQAVCAHALNESSVLVIKDLRDDDRTYNNTLVTGKASLRFYAGVPLRLDTNFGVGTLCVLDTKPHPEGLTLSQIEGLKALGRQATMLLQIRRFLAENKEHETEHFAVGDTLGEPLEEISDALVRAFTANKIYNDKVLDSLIASSLTHIALQIAKSDKTNHPPIH